MTETATERANIQEWIDRWCSLRRSGQDVDIIRKIFDAYMFNPEGRRKVLQSCYQPARINLDFRKSKARAARERGDVIAAHERLITWKNSPWEEWEQLLMAIPSAERDSGEYQTLLAVIEEARKFTHKRDVPVPPEIGLPLVGEVERIP
jgi:hypothetical protein